MNHLSSLYLIQLNGAELSTLDSITVNIQDDESPTALRLTQDG
jgi:hypothetical protein